jgi:asparagine synthase (glutamine-hydrolysing)
MCGIVGVLARGAVDATVVAGMRDRLAHRGPDHAGLWTGGDGQVCLGHRRLAIIDLDPEANGPFLSTDGRFAITFNGEIYNYRALRSELERDGVRFRTASDTEVLVEAWRRWGAACLERLSGQFAFAIWDGERRELCCARDRAGEKPFYYATCGDAFVFGSELKALVAWPGFQRAVHAPAVVDFLSFGFIADPKTIWKGCHKLPPGHWMRVCLPPGGAPEPAPPEAYWDLVFASDRGICDWSEAILDALRAAADEMAVADVPLGTFLSGGVDSSAVTAALSLAGHDVRSFTVGFEDEAYDERPWARSVAERYRTSHTERVVAPDDLAAVFDAMLWHYDEPFGDYSYLPTYYLCREARRAITVALSGDGGDEVFAGYRRYQRLALRERAARLASGRGLQLAAGAAARLARSPARRRTFGQYAAPDDELLTDVLTLGLSAADLGPWARGPLAATLREYTARDAVVAHLGKAPPGEVGLINAMRYLDLKLTLAGGILVKVDRASMAVSLEVRPVFLHRGVLALGGRIPPSQLAGPGSAKRALKRALEAWLPRPLLYRRKQGFALPLSRWLAGEDAAALLAPATGASAELVDPALRTRLAAEHASGRADRTQAIHNLIVLDRWLAKWA